jgi:hypothetical protein
MATTVAHNIIVACMGAQTEAQTPITATTTTDKLLHVIYIKFSQYLAPQDHAGA